MSTSQSDPADIASDRLLFALEPPDRGVVAACDEVAENVTVCTYRINDGRTVSVVATSSGEGWFPARTVVD